MFAAHVVVVVTAALNALSAGMDLAGSRFVLANAEANGVPLRWVPVLGGLKGAAALGLLAGLAGLTWLWVAAAAGLLVFFAGAVVVHARAGTWSTAPAPACFLALAATSLWLALAG
ncbi:DoxX family protein [Saccharopolyspora rhizosphaerae]|uniref:DoxX family protein n=2 Tax=Saccharopolyspora rhizosphaerae TaxID=2492662 RepID=A0A3R8P6Q3_9PSEU|nr:DoxX family protein [Saccharopolyspora rhizosphaerae]